MGDNSEARGAVGEYKAGWHDPEESTIRFDFGLSEEVVREISNLKNEPQWMTDVRVKAFNHFSKRKMPTWGNMSMLEEIDFDNICYYLRSSESTEKDWDDVPEDIRNTFERLGIPEAEQKWLRRLGKPRSDFPGYGERAQGISRSSEKVVLFRGPLL